MNCMPNAHPFMPTRTEEDNSRQIRSSPGVRIGSIAVALHVNLNHRHAAFLLCLIVTTAGVRVLFRLPLIVRLLQRKTVGVLRPSGAAETITVLLTHDVAIAALWHVDTVAKVGRN